MIPLVGFLPRDDPRVVGTVDAIERELLRDGLSRYRTQRARSTGCRRARASSCPAASGWPTTTPSRAGGTRRRRCSSACWPAQRRGLLAEEYDPRGKRLLGNFPQAFSHLALVNTAFNLAKMPKTPPSTGASKDVDVDVVLDADVVAVVLLDVRP